MDYKQRGRQYADLGNFNYGATGTALGIPEVVLLRAAGYAQEAARTSTSGWGVYWGRAPYGDDPSDQKQIKAGIEYAKRRGF
ncbi:polymorphic toxin type 44 domain-containing protein [Silvimonas soli]|uniref:polymorphic toxin type 44 domain-containing protein n=1 Tax=Silvimonas soli TaxID=2980100 RepID=UPI0024B327F2|nr:polymorphic toxin type 44 domain-containing protein [Silvimonas soli]